MKSFSNFLTVALVVFAGSGPCLHRATAQTNGGEIQKPNPAVPPPLAALPQRYGPSDLFNFPGGTPLEFITAAKNQLKVDWVGIATIPTEMGGIQVPKLRVSVQQADQLLKLYNRLGEQNPTLGKWVWEGPANYPTVLMLVPSDKSPPVAKLPEPPMESAVFLLTYISGTNLITAAEALKALDDVAERNARAAGQTPVPYHVIIDQRTSSLILSGSREYVNMASNLLMKMDIPMEIPPPQNAPGQPAARGRQ
jgi:hypothetical protein